MDKASYEFGIRCAMCDCGLMTKEALHVFDIASLGLRPLGARIGKRLGGAHQVRKFIKSLHTSTPNVRKAKNVESYLAAVRKDLPEMQRRAAEHAKSTQKLLEKLPAQHHEQLRRSLQLTDAVQKGLASPNFVSSARDRVLSELAKGQARGAAIGSNIGLGLGAAGAGTLAGLAS